jgi:AraC family transcriptional regulator
MKPETRSFYEIAVESAALRVIADLDHALELQALARKAALSPFHFHRVFRGMLGETPLELQRRLRLERAAFRLAHDEEPVTRIALEAGYETHESFTRAFRAAYGRSPSEFRLGAPAAEGRCVRPYSTALQARSGIHYQPTPSPLEGIVRMKGDDNMNVELKTLNELRLATVRHVGPYNRISEAFARLGDVVGPAGLIGPESQMLALYHDDPETTPLAELRSDAAVTVPEGKPIPQELVEQRLPGGLYACVRHVGSYDKLPDVWSRFLGEWLPASQHRMKDGVSFEIYRNTPENAAKDQLVTELYAPLEA